MTPHSNATSIILNQLIEVITQLRNNQYAMPVPVLSGNSIGKHIRHIVEFYQCLVIGYPDGVVDYDTRKRNEEIETNVISATDSIHVVKDFIALASDKLLTLSTTYPGAVHKIDSESSLSREVVYNIEHAIHHMAIIKIALISSFPEVVLPDNFGVAFSTQQHLIETCAP